MLTLEEIPKWQQIKINNDLKNYTRKRLSVVEARVHFFIEVHGKIIEGTPVEIKKFLDHVTNATEQTHSRMTKINKQRKHKLAQMG